MAWSHSWASSSLSFPSDSDWRRLLVGSVHLTRARYGVGRSGRYSTSVESRTPKREQLVAGEVHGKGGEPDLKADVCSVSCGDAQPFRLSSRDTNGVTVEISGDHRHVVPDPLRGETLAGEFFSWEEPCVVVDAPCAHVRVPSLPTPCSSKSKPGSGFLARGRLRKVMSPGTPCGVFSAVDFQVRQNEQCTQEVSGAGGIGAKLGQDPPVLEVGEVGLDGMKNSSLVLSGVCCYRGCDTYVVSREGIGGGSQRGLLG